MIDLLDNCQFGNYKFLFISWTFAVRLDYGENKNLPISLITIDEAHCVSQWDTIFVQPIWKFPTLKRIFPKFLSCFNRNRNAE
jgi:ATP-dependent DNA helicase RecQ